MSATGGPKRTTPIIGGINKPKPIDKRHPLAKSDPDLERILVQLSSKIQYAYIRAAMIADSAPTFEPVSYATQVVAGTNYYVNQRVTQHGWYGKNCGGGGDNDAEYCHVKIFWQPWTNTAELTGIAVRKTKQDPFEYDMPAP
ncbi:hypothetical protein BGZ96_006409 [Linnemannia gamsii]|uniref:Cystatin domain-containing protein n=1 Tax=Linnemannia gamsii TaxID=64522 RepID=A0ABQ7KG87_9FUNG|nr:hypothetical protein BGZ96_006409 [Linnemannia gamsii]